MLLEEQKNTIAAFRKNIDKEKFGSFVIYGTGINAEAIVQNCKEYPILGIMDLAKTGQTFCDLPVLSPDEILERQIGNIIVVARPAVHTIIYKRIREWCVKNQVEVFDIYGMNMEEKLQSEVWDLPYFHVSYEQLIDAIDAHEIISFDIFDTIFMRKVYEPTDVFGLLDSEVGEKVSCCFSKIRREAEGELLKEGEPDIYQIYQRMGEKYPLSLSQCRYLMEKELEKEREVLRVRESMRQCIEYCREQRKRFFFVSDMYLPSEILRGFLEDFQIRGYEDILVSCEHQTSKTNGLFQILKEKAKGKSYLHIGDNQEADGRAAKRNGIDSFLIMPSVRMLESSSYRDALGHLNGVESRVMLGIFASKVFQDPFALYESSGKPEILLPEVFGFLFIGPLVVSFLVWMLQVLEKERSALLLFSSRDGWLIQKAYHILKENWKLEELPEDLYFLISRKAVLEIEEEMDGPSAASYQTYLESLNLGRYRELYFFDFMSRGTCQSKLENLIGRKIKGLYFQRSFSGDAQKDAVQVKAYLKEVSAQESNLRIFAMCDFLECIFTSYQPSFLRFQANGKVVYDRERRSERQLKCLKEIHQGILSYCRCFSGIIKRLPSHMPSVKFCDELLQYTSETFSRIGISDLKDFILDDGLEGNKNTGRDVLN
ncbi:MAG: hypothetical protein HFJ10_00785 [Lachnospiraceae bacterium]|nr:hypothetical protein [Lachnospiraceae bacterium]